jgi:hypothetical protein
VHDERRHVDAYRDDGSSGRVAKIRETAERVANGESVGNGEDPLRVLAGLVRQLAEEVSVARPALRIMGRSLPSTGPPKITLSE